MRGWSNIYSPKIYEKFIPTLYQLAKARKVRMTHIVNDVIGRYLKGLGDNVIDIEKIKKQFDELGLDYDE